MDCKSRQNVEATLKPILKHHLCGSDINAPCDHWTETIKDRRRESETDPFAVGQCYVLTCIRDQKPKLIAKQILFMQVQYTKSFWQYQCGTCSSH